MILIMMKLVYIEEVVKSIDKWMRGSQAQLTRTVGQKSFKVGSVSIGANCAPSPTGCWRAVTVCFFSHY